MQIIIQGHGLDLSPALKSYAHKKFSKLTHFFENIQKIDIILDARNIANTERSHVTECTVWASGKKVMRATEAGSDMYAAIDLTYDEIERQVKKHKDKFTKERRRQAEKAKVAMRESTSSKTTENEPRIVDVSSFASKPMDEAEALAEFKVLNQDFFMFRNRDTGNVSLVCKKNRKAQVIESKKLKSITPEEAKKELAGKKASFYTFINTSTNQTNVIYKQKSGNYGLVEPKL